jgi:hypothetical protein
MESEAQVQRLPVPAPDELLTEHVEAGVERAMPARTKGIVDPVPASTSSGQLSWLSDDLFALQ